MRPCGLKSQRASSGSQKSSVSIPELFLPTLIPEDAGASKYARTSSEHSCPTPAWTHFGVIIHGADRIPRRSSAAQSIRSRSSTIQGWWDLIASKSVAVVGTREPSARGQSAREKSSCGHTRQGRFYRRLRPRKGNRYRCPYDRDSMQGGRTIAVIGTPLSLRYPKENANLQDRIAKEHLLISQVPIVRYQQVTQNPTANRFFFVERNITMSALTLGTIIVEAGETSGTLVQARHALKQGKKLFILESNFKNPALTWPAKFEQQGAIRVTRLRGHPEAPCRHVSQRLTSSPAPTIIPGRRMTICYYLGEYTARAGFAFSHNKRS